MYVYECVYVSVCVCVYVCVCVCGKPLCLLHQPPLLHPDSQQGWRTAIETFSKPALQMDTSFLPQQQGWLSSRAPEPFS